MKQRIYIDTSVAGGYFDDEFSEGTIPFFERAKNGEIALIVSDLLMPNQFFLKKRLGLSLVGRLST